MPSFWTVAGQCQYTKEDKKSMEIMLRTHEQSRSMHLPNNGEYDWPDYRAFEMCPLCCKRAKPGGDAKYWMVLQNLLQRTPDRMLAIKFLPRLVCVGCFGDIDDGTSIEVGIGNKSNVQSVPVTDVIEAQGPVTWLRDGEGMCALTAPHYKSLNAYLLYGIWDNSGAYQSLVDRYVQDSSDSVCWVQSDRTKKPDDPKKYWTTIRSKVGRTCDGPGCAHVHGDRLQPNEGESKGKRVKLLDCTGCYETMYCSQTCQHSAWTEHKVLCREIQSKRKEEEKMKRAQDEKAREAAYAAAAASFVPASVEPQGGGGNKKKSSKKNKGKK